LHAAGSLTRTHPAYSSLSFPETRSVVLPVASSTKQLHSDSCIFQPGTALYFRRDHAVRHSPLYLAKRAPYRRGPDGLPPSTLSVPYHPLRSSPPHPEAGPSPLPYRRP